jgi:hypothetical protein
VENQWEELWAFDGVPAQLTDQIDPAAVETFRLAPSSGRIASRIFTIHPRTASQTVTGDSSWDSSRFDYSETEELDSSGHPWMHRTPTIDIIVIISGAMDLILDGGDEVRLETGDSVIQRGTMHGWRNEGPDPCVAVAFMVRAE